MMPLLRILTTVTVAALATAALAAQDKKGDSKELSQAETEVRVKNDVAKRLGLRPEDARIAGSSERIWPDAGLGCNARRGMFEERRQGVPGDGAPARIPGFEIVAEAGGRRFVYHTDRRGRLLRCSTPRKPIDRIQ